MELAKWLEKYGLEVAFESEEMKDLHVVGTCGECLILKNYGNCEIKEARENMCGNTDKGNPFGCLEGNWEPKA